MKMYLLSLVVGLFVGILYYLLDVKSPAPSFSCLIGFIRDGYWRAIYTSHQNFN